jgi:hypothetical protein
MVLNFPEFAPHKAKQGNSAGYRVKDYLDVLAELKYGNE